MLAQFFPHQNIQWKDFEYTLIIGITFATNELNLENIQKDLKKFQDSINAEVS
jgi:hypothetical protein